MPSEPTPAPRGGRPAAERQFVGREEFITPVHTALKEPQRTKPLVLVYYGGAGIGKSRLRRELTKQLAADPGVLTAVLDFDIPSYRQPESALLFLRKTIREAYKVRFLSFDLAYAIYWQKTHPEAPLGDDLKPLLEPGSLLFQLLDDSGKLPLIGLVPRISALVSERPKTEDGRPETEGRGSATSYLLPSNYYATWWRQRGERELEDLPQMEPGAIVDCLPKLWAADLKDHLGAASRKPQASSKEPGGSPESRVQSPEVGQRRAVMFIDSYEKLWGTGDGGQKTGDSRQKTDEWVRELVKQLPEVLWIICGRQKLRWAEVEADWGSALSQHQLGALPDKSARRFLESCDITDGQIQDGIIKGSQGVPHYLNLAADALQNAEGKLQNAKFGGGSPEELVEQFTQQLDKPEVETLKVLSAARFWYYGLFEHLITQYQTGYPVTGYDDLSRFSFVSEGAAPETRTMHELMREALQESQSPELRKRVHLFLHELYAKQLEGLAAKDITDRHKAALTEAFYHARQVDNATELWAWFLVAEEVFHRAHLYQFLVPLYRDVCKALESELSPNHPDIAAALDWLGEGLVASGEFGEAESILHRALAVAESNSGFVHPDHMHILFRLGCLHHARGDFGEAEVLFKKVVEQRDNDPHSAPDARVGALDALAQVLTSQRRYEESEVLHRRALDICERELGLDHLDTAATLGSLANSLIEQARYSEAEPLARRALGAAERGLGAESPQAVLELKRLGMILHGQGRLSEAEQVLRRGLALVGEIHGPRSDDTMIAMNNLAAALFDLGEYAEAESLLRRPLAVFEDKFGPLHPNTLRTTNALIRALLKQGRHDEAEPLALNAVATRERELGPDHPETASALFWAGVLYQDKGRYADSESYLRRAADIQSRSVGKEHWLTLRSFDALALLEERQGMYVKAESSHRSVLEKRERVRGPEHPDVADTVVGLARLCSRDGRYAEAEALYRRALAIREKVFGPDHTFVAEPLEGLAKVCEQTGRAAEAQELSARAKRIRAQAEPAPTTPRP
jgi:tetratricopeptide (TPR) repeat protein